MDTRIKTRYDGDEVELKTGALNTHLLYLDVEVKADGPDSFGGNFVVLDDDAAIKLAHALLAAVVGETTI